MNWCQMSGDKSNTAADKVVGGRVGEQQSFIDFTCKHTARKVHTQECLFCVWCVLQG